MPKEFIEYRRAGWKNFVGMSHCRSPKGALAFIGYCGFFWCSQRAALIDQHRLRGAFFWLWQGTRRRCFSITRACPPVLKYFIRHTSSGAY